MGTSSTPAELAAKFGRAASALDDSTREGVREAAIVGKVLMESALPVKNLTNYGRNGRKLGAKFTAPKGDPPYSVLSYYGPVQLVNTGARPHLIGPKGWRRGRARGRLKFTRGDDGVRSGVVYHPGTKGSTREFFPGAVDKVRAAAPDQMKAAARRSLMSVFG